ncbi:MAG: hypothetical protein LBI69_05045 [Puniceicoccales bacterium]|jgi:hypothetical protein|nr:hypothetical protein [Puniceicoccales bacterium]
MRNDIENKIGSSVSRETEIGSGSHFTDVMPRNEASPDDVDHFQKTLQGERNLGEHNNSRGENGFFSSLYAMLSSSGNKGEIKMTYGAFEIGIEDEFPIDAEDDSDGSEASEGEDDLFPSTADLIALIRETPQSELPESLEDIDIDELVRFLESMEDAGTLGDESAASFLPVLFIFTLLFFPSTSVATPVSTISARFGLYDVVDRIVDQVLINEAALASGQDVKFQLKDCILDGTGVQLFRDGDSLRIIFTTPALEMTQLIQLHQGILVGNLEQRLDIANITIAVKELRSGGDDEELTNGDGDGRSKGNSGFASQDESGGEEKSQ